MAITPHVWERLIKVVRQELDLETSELSKDTTADDLGADSLDLVELLMSIEEEFALEVTDDEAAKWRTLGDVATWLDEQVHA